MIANTEKMKMENSILPTTFAFPSQIFEKIARHPYPIIWKLNLLPPKKGLG